MYSRNWGRKPTKTQLSMTATMSLCEYCSFNKSLSCYLGKIDYGVDIELEVDCTRNATEALVFLLKGLKGLWKFPLAVCFIDKIRAKVQVRLLEMASEYPQQYLIRIHGNTCDGTMSNFSMFKIMGCSFDPDNMATKWNNGSYALFDNCRMMKLARNTLHRVRITNLYTVGATSERTAAGKTEKLIFRAFFSSKM